MATVLTFQSGPLEARVFVDTGGVALAGPDRAGAAHATVITFRPPIATEGQERTVGRVVSSAPLGNGFDLVQDAGGTNVAARLTFPADGVMRYEVTDWYRLSPDQVSVAADSDGRERSWRSALFSSYFGRLSITCRLVLSACEPGWRSSARALPT